jgi:hypothetical protein
MVICIAGAALISALALATTASAKPTFRTTTKVCRQLPCKTIVQNQDWRIFRQRLRGSDSKMPAVRNDLWGVRAGSKRAVHLGRWTDSADETSKFTKFRINGNYLAIGGTYETGISQGTVIQVFDLTRAIRVRIEGPLAPSIDSLLLSPDGAVVISTTAGPEVSLDAYDVSGRQTLVTGQFTGVMLVGSTIYWTDEDGMHALLLTGPAVNEQTALSQD